MIEVPIDKIIPLDEIVTDIAKVMKTASEEKSLFVITKNGKPYVAIIDVGYLEHLPEIDNASKTKPIHEIGKPGDQKEKKPEEPQSPQKNTTQKQSQENQETTPDAIQKTKNTNQKPSNIYDENIGPWKKQNEEKPTEGNNLNEPPDLPLD